jgi:hypothetical protein
MRLFALMCVLMSALPQRVDAQAASAKPWRMSTSIGTGWNDNPAAIGNTITFGGPTTAVPFISDKGSAFGRFTLDTSYDLVANDDRLLTLGYGLHADVYENDAEEVNFQMHQAWLGYQRRVSENTSVSLQIANEYINIGANGFSNAILLEPSLYHRFTERVAIELNYRAGFVDMMFPVVGAGFDRDGVNHDLGAMLDMDIHETLLQGRLGYRHRWSFTEEGNGGLYDYDSDVLILGLSHPLPCHIQADFTFTYQWDDYAGIGVGGGAIRSDEVSSFSALLTRPINDTVRAYVRYDDIDAESNGTLFDYRQRVVATGAICEF